MKILLGQINPTPCDWAGNITQVQDGILLAIENNVQLAIFPELCLCGYLHQDKIYDPNFVKKSLQSLQDIIEFTKAVGPSKPYVVVGYVDHNHSGSGKPFRNMAAVVHNGILIGTYQKQLLPYYDVFDEGRYFEPGSQPFVFSIRGERWGLVICEDWWNDKGQDDYNYSENPIKAYKDLDVKNIISINSSHFEVGKATQRIERAKESLRIGNFIFVNQRGAVDELVFDGNSFIISNSGLFTLCDNKESPYYHVVDLKQSNRWLPHEFKEDESIYDALLLGLRDYIKKSNFKEVVIGSSGGIDSAMVLMLACDAIGPNRVHGIRMPSIFSSDHSLEDAKQLHKNLGCHDHLVPVNHTELLNQINTLVKEKHYNAVADENIQARLRAVTLMHLSNAYNWLLLTTGNKTESAIGYCTLGGDMMGGFAPIKDLLKSQVYQMAMYASNQRIPSNIISKKPSAELRPNQTDEEFLLPYPILDAIVIAYTEGFISTFSEFLLWIVIQNDTPKWYAKDVFKIHPIVSQWIKKSHAQSDYERIMKMVTKSEFKRRLSAPGIKLTRTAFGIGRRVPIVG